MKKMFVVIIVTALLMACLTAYAADKGSAVKSGSVETAFKSTFPQIKFDSFGPSPIKGLYEVIAGNNILYYSSEGYLIFGELWSKDGQSVTAKRHAALMDEKAKNLKLADALKIGSGKNIVIEISDPDCPYCRKASAFLPTARMLHGTCFFFRLHRFTRTQKNTHYIFYLRIPRRLTRKSILERWTTKNSTFCLMSKKRRAIG